MSSIAERYTGKHVLITGGLGMIGSTIAGKLARAGADVTLVDACIEPYGANHFNIADIRDKVRVNIADIRDKEAMKCLVRGQDVIFNLAGQVSHNDSMDAPFLDADINYIGHLNVLECVRQHNPGAVILHAGSRLQFGQITQIPVNEEHPLRPRSPYALNKTAAENMYLFYHNLHGTRCIATRISNPYGPRAQMKHSKYCIVNFFIRQAMDGKTIKVFGDGSQVRDYIYIDDLAEAFLNAGSTEACIGQVVNLGSGEPTTFAKMVEVIRDVVGNGHVEHVPWPANYINVETGDYVADIRKLKTLTAWAPRTGFAEGVQRTFDFYRMHRQHYW